jgi:O-antigen ligase
MIFKNFNLWRNKNKNNFSLIINYLFIFYAFSIPISGKLTEIVFSLILIIYLFNGNLKNNIINALKNKFIQALLLFFFIHVIWLFGSDNKIFAYETINNSRFLLYGVIYITAIRKDFILMILNGFLAAMMFSEIVSYLIYFQIINPINNATIDNPVPFVLSHTQYAIYLSISMGLMLYISLKEKINMSIKIIYFLFFITASANIFIISSRLGFIMYAVNIIFITAYIFKKDIFKFLYIGITTLLIGYILAYNYSGTFNKRINQTINSINYVILDNNYHTSLGTRLGYWVYSYDIILDNLIFGVGDGDQKTLIKENILNLENNPSNIKALLHSIQGGLHSDFLDILVKFGFIGLLIYLNIFYQLYKYIPLDKTFRILQFLLIISFFLGGLQGGTIMLKDLGKLFTLLAVLTVIDSVRIRDRKNDSK